MAAGSWLALVVDSSARVCGMLALGCGRSVWVCGMWVLECGSLELEGGGTLWACVADGAQLSSLVEACTTLGHCSRG